MRWLTLGLCITSVQVLAQEIWDTQEEFPHTPLESDERSFWFRPPVSWGMFSARMLIKPKEKMLPVGILEGTTKGTIQSFVQLSYDPTPAQHRIFISRGNIHSTFRNFLIGIGTVRLRFLRGWVASGALKGPLQWEQHMVVRLLPKPVYYNYRAVGGGVLGYTSRSFAWLVVGGRRLDSYALHPFGGHDPVTGTSLSYRNNLWILSASWLGVLEGDFNGAGGVRIHRKGILDLIVVVDHQGDMAGSIGLGLPVKNTMFEAYAVGAQGDFYTPEGRVFSPVMGSISNTGPFIETGLRSTGDLWGIRFRGILDFRKTSRTRHLRASLEVTGKKGPWRAGTGLAWDALLWAAQRYHGSRSLIWRLKLGYVSHYGGIIFQQDLAREYFDPLYYCGLMRIWLGLFPFRVLAGGLYRKGYLPGSSYSSQVGVWGEFNWRYRGRLEVFVKGYAWRGMGRKYESGLSLLSGIKFF